MHMKCERHVGVDLLFADVIILFAALTLQLT